MMRVKQEAVDAALHIKQPLALIWLIFLMLSFVGTGIVPDGR